MGRRTYEMSWTLGLSNDPEISEAEKQKLRRYGSFGFLVSNMAHYMRVSERNRIFSPYYGYKRFPHLAVSNFVTDKSIISPIMLFIKVYRKLYKIIFSTQLISWNQYMLAWFTIIGAVYHWKIHLEKDFH